MAKQMIRMICKLGKLIDEDPAVRGKLRIVYLEDYCVSLSERLMPASEVSEQISGRHRGIRHRQHEVHAERRDHAGHAGRRER